MKNVSIKKRARKNNNNNKKYNKTQTKRSRRNKTQRNKTQRNNRRRRNFRNKTHRGGVHSLSQGRNAHGVPSSSAVRRVPGYDAAKSIRAPTNPVAKKAAANLGLSAPTSERRGIKIPPLNMESRSSRNQLYYNPRDIDLEEVQEDISVEIQQMKEKIGPLFLEIKEKEEKNTKLQESYISASAEERSIMSGSIGDQVRQNYGEIAEKKREIDNLERSIKDNEDAMKNFAKNIAKIINDSKIHENEDKANTPHGIITAQMRKRGPGEKDSWRFFLIKNFPGLAHYFYKYPESSA